MMFRNRCLERRAAVTVLAIDFEFLQVNWQFLERKCSDTTGGKIEPSAALHLGPMHVIGMLVSHQWARLNLLQ